LRTGKFILYDKARRLQKKVEKQTAKKQRVNNGKRDRIENGSGLIKGAIIINPAYAVTQMCQTVSASTQRRSFKAAAKGFFPDYMVSFRDKPVDVPRGPSPQRRINIYIYIKLSIADANPLNCFVIYF
jgi:hypothetical protein